MAGIDDIISGVGGNTRADFSHLSDGFDAYNNARDQKAKNDLRDAFKGGVPTNPDGSLDISSVMKTLFQKGDIAGGVGLAGASVGAADRAALGNVDGPQAQQAPVISPSVNRQVPIAGNAPVRAAPAGTATPSQEQPTIMKVLAAQGIPNDQLGAASASVARQMGIDPTAPLDLQDPQVRNVLAPAVAQIKKMGLGQVQPPQPGDNQQAPPQAQVAQAPQMAPQAAPQGFQPSPSQQAAQNDPVLKRLTLLTASPDKPTAAAAKVRLEAYLKNQEATTEMKNAGASGMGLPAYQEKQGELAAQQAGATENAKAYVAKYQAINEAGDKAVSEIPKLQLALKQMDDPNYYSGPLNQYNLGAKRLVAALGGDPDKAAPQEIVNKITADSLLSGMGALKGLGPIRVQEMKILAQASMAPDNSIPAQKFLATMAIRVQERVAKVSDMAQNYNEGVLDNGFDKQIRTMDKKEPLFSQVEIERFQRITQGKEKQSPQSNQPAGAPRQFSSPSDVHAAVASGQLKKGDTFTDPNGKTRMVP